MLLLVTACASGSSASSSPSGEDSTGPATATAQGPSASSTPTALSVQAQAVTPWAVTPTQPPTPPIPTPSMLAMQCEPPLYPGILHCTQGSLQIIRLDPKNPQVRVEVVLPQGYDRHGFFGECRDVHLPDSLPEGRSQGPGCYRNGQYPAEFVGTMARRHPAAVAAINADFFSFPDYAYGPVGLTVKDGERLDGRGGDEDGHEIRRSSLSIAANGDIRIGPVDPASIPDPARPWTWIPDAVDYFTTVGGLPQLVRNGEPVDLERQCIEEQGWCPDPYRPRARTAVGVLANGELLLVVVPEEPGIELAELSRRLAALGAVDAINLDGGGSSQLWYDGEYVLFQPRPVVEALVVLSLPAPPGVPFRGWVVDDSSDSFVRQSIGETWRVRPVGVGGYSLLIPNTAELAAAMGTWTLDIPAPGAYDVLAFILGVQDATQHAQYQIYHAGRLEDVVVSQLVSEEQWVSLGIFDFEGEGVEFVRLTAATGEADGSTQLVYDAIALRQPLILQAPAVANPRRPGEFEIR
ncbi:MAG TPA: phosphodiester glycosidase family protein [Anaerolineales bacterium]|nr:phosphodiester glycosidase family protein [Anaerolineales bacterium]